MKRWMLVLLLAGVLAVAGCGRSAAPKAAPAGPGQGGGTAPPAAAPDGGAPAQKPAEAPRTVAVKVYFSDPEAMFLHPVTRQAAAAHPALDAVQALAAGPAAGEADLRPTLPAGVKVLGVTIADGVATVNFARELKEKFGGGSTGEIMLVYSVVNTLTEFENVKGVALQVEGQPLPTLGHLDMTRPLPRRPDLIKP